MEKLLNINFTQELTNTYNFMTDKRLQLNMKKHQLKENEKSLEHDLIQIVKFKDLDEPKI